MSGDNCRLLLVVPSGTSFLTFFREVAVGWSARGEDVTVATGPDLPGQSPPWPAGIDRLPLPAFRTGAPWNLAVAGWQLARFVSRWNPTIVHAHFAAAVLVAAVAKSVSPPRPRLWIGTYHGMHLAASGQHRSSLVARVEAWAAQRMDRVCVLNDEDQLAIRSYVSDEQVRVVPTCGLGCDLAVFDPSRYPMSVRDATRARLGIASNAFVVAYVGRRTAFKGFDIAVRGFLEAGIDHSAMLFVGSPDRTHAHGLSAAECDALTSDRRFVDVGWQNDVAPLLAVADVCLLPSTREGMPVTAMEALCLGVPVITVDARGCRDVVRDGVDGVVMSEARADSVAAVLRGLAADRPRLDTMAAAAISGRGRFDRSHYVADEIAFYAREVARLRDSADNGARTTL